MLSGTHPGRPQPHPLPLATSRRALALAGEARALAESAGDELARAQAHNLLGALAWEEGRLDVARRELSAASRWPPAAQTAAEIRAVGR